MQLVAYGAQDVYLTGNPQITFFKVVYRRHTNFAQECIEQTFSGAVGPSKRVTATLARNGDLVKEIYVNLTGGTAGQDNTDLIEWAEVEIGGQTIDKQYTAWMDIYNQLFETNHDYRLALCNKASVHVPLRFWFNRNPGLALPLIALQYHEVKVNIQLGDSAGTTGSLLVNYVYLDTDERRRFAQVSHEYLIEQVQHTGSETLSGTGNNKITLNYNHPVKALFWSSSAALDKMKLQLNGHDRASEQGDLYYRVLQPYESGLGHSKVMQMGSTDKRKWYDLEGNISDDTTGVSSHVYMYSFALKPGEHQPSGTCNFSRIDNAVLNMTGSSGATVNVHALNYNVLRIMSGMGGLAYSN